MQLAQEEGFEEMATLLKNYVPKTAEELAAEKLAAEAEEEEDDEDEGFYEVKQK